MRVKLPSYAHGLAHALLVLCLAILLAPSVLAVEFTTNTTITSSDLNGEPIIVTGCTLTIDCSGGVGSYASLLVRSGGVVTHPAGSANGLWLQFSGDVTVEAGSRIDADARGYGSQLGPGGGSSGAGASHGGTGGYGGKAVYDSVTAPSQLGSGGGNTSGGYGGAGGGLIRITTPGTMTIAGEVRADGAGVNNAGGGSGGSIFLDVGVITGGGVISARGGSSNGASYTYGGGGGGRISVLYGTDTYTGQVHTHGGTGRNASEANNGGPGTLYYKGSSEPYGVLVFDNGTVSGWTVHPSFDMSDTDLILRFAKISFNCSGGPIRVHNLSVGNTSTVTHVATLPEGLDFRVGGDAIIENGSQLNVSGRGYGAQLGPGGGSSGAGGSHGGTGGYGGKAVYDSITAPSDLGSGGGNTSAGTGGEGGGLVRLEV
ncbi:MAG: hypothetical protein GX446_13585, partial [Chthonomonadales bacterium]|nr:hypothetical protein [Chthonomonadales bacterium]